MLLKVFLKTGLAFSFIIAGAFFAKLQSQVKVVGYQCCECRPCVNFSTLEEINNHNCAVHPALCSSSGSAASFSMGRHSASPIQNGLLLGLCGLTAGSFMKDANGNNQALTGALIGYPTGTILNILLKPKKRSVFAKLFTGVTTGASLGGALAQIEKASQNPADPAKPDKTLERTLEGAVVGGIGAVVTGGLNGFHKKTKGGYSFLLRKKKILSKTAFTMTGNRIGIRIFL